MKTTIDAAGRLVIPREIRDEAGLVPGAPLVVTCNDGRVEIEPEPLAVDVVSRGRIKVAVPKGEVPPLRAAIVEATRRQLDMERHQGKRSERVRAKRKR